MNIEEITKVENNPKIPVLAPGDTVRISAKIIEGEKERTQLFQGVVIRQRRSGIASSVTLRRVSYGVGVERTFPLHSPLVEKIEIVRHGKARRAKLYYLRGLSAKASRIKERRVARVAPELQAAPEEPTVEQPAAAEKTE